jgi:transposase
MSRLHLTTWQRQRLRRQLAQARDVRLFQRTLAILEFDRGRSAAEVARMLGVSRQGVYNWVEAYSQALDPASLHDQGGSGRRPLLDEDQEHFLESLLAISPQEVGYSHTGWTVPLLQEALQIATGQQVSDDTLRRTLHRLGYAWKRPRYDLLPDPRREKKTPDSPANPGPAQAERGAGPGRDRPAAVPALAGRLVEGRRARQGLAERAQRPARGLRGDEPADGQAAVRAAPEGEER